MYRYANLFLVGFLLFWVSSSASKRDKTTVEELIYQVLLQPKIEQKISLDFLEKVSKKENSEKTGNIWIIDENILRKLGVPVDDLVSYALRDLRNMKGRFDTLDNFQWKYDSSKEKILSDNQWVLVTVQKEPEK